MSVYILGGARTASGSFLGQFSNTKVSILGAAAITGALKKSNITADQIDEVFMGNVLTSAVGQAPARQAALGANLPISVPCTTIGKVCGSGMKSIITAAQTIMAQDNKVVVAGGMENMSMSPHILEGSRKGFKFGATTFLDSMQYDGLTDAYANAPMGNFAELCVEKFSFTRQEQDEFAMESFKRAQAATEAGIFNKEIEAVTVKSRKGSDDITKDEGVFLANFEKIPKLRPAFIKDGTITAANASSINDGAAAIILGDDSFKDQAKFKIISYASYAAEPEWFTTAPAQAMKSCLNKASMNLDQIDLFEINEAFAVVTMATMKELEIDHKKVNILGGAVSLGHPIGCSGTRIVVTLMSALESKNAQFGMASICIGGGEALAILIERL